MNNILLHRVHIQNIRSIKEANVTLGNSAVLFGMNDSGKSNFLYALKLALGSANIEKIDIFSALAFPYSEESTAVIDLMFIPINDQGERVKNFDDKWGLYLGVNVSPDDDDNEYFAYRTEFTYDMERAEYRRERNIITKWDDTTIVIGNVLRARTLEAFDFTLINAQRDIAADIRDRSSMWSKQVSRIKLSTEATTEIEASLHTLSDRIVQESPFLTQVSQNLSEATNTRNSAVEISPITRNVDELYKGLDIYVAQEAADSFPIANMGLGTRSRAVFSSMKTIVNRQLQTAVDNPYFCLLAFEEPEAHIHPHSQKQLINDLSQINAQQIITTHSPYLLSMAKLDDLVYCSMYDAQTFYISISSLGLSADDIRQIRRFVLNTHGDMLFANVVILAEGETEEQSLQIFCKEYFNLEAFELGISIIGVGGKNYLPFLRLLQNVGIKWFVFSDGEPAAISDLVTTMKKLIGTQQNLDLSDFPQIIILDNSADFEIYLLANGYDNEIITAINAFEDGVEAETGLNYFEHFKDEHHGEPLKSQNTGETCSNCHQPIKAKLLRDYRSEGGDHRALKDCMKSGKAKYSTMISKIICETCAEDRKFPPKIRELFDKVSMYI